MLAPDIVGSGLDRRFCIAPMMDWTDRHCRYLLRLIFPEALLYTEMVTAAAVYHGDRTKLLRFDPAERPLALQFGGNEPESMAIGAEQAEAFGYDEVNINVGCPSDRVQSGCFGARLMAEPHRVADCVAAMRRATSLPVTVKTRIGIDAMDDYEGLRDFVAVVADAGCDTFIVHARKAWLQGLSPKQNREVPPLRYEYVYRLKREFPRLNVIINGGITEAAAVVDHLRYVDGVMVGREAYQNPFGLVDVRNRVFGTRQAAADRRRIVECYMRYIEQRLSEGVYLKHMTRHMLGLFQGVPGAKRWRRILSERSPQPGAGLEVVQHALDAVECNEPVLN